MFKKLYNKVLSWAEHPYAIRFLIGLSFIESSCFPIPPDVMLAPMSMAQPKKAWYYAFIATLFSVLGGAFGYALGLWAYYTVVIPLLEFLNKQQAYELALVWFEKWGVFAVIIAGFTPIPYKLFTIAAGVLQMNFPLFILGSIIGRGGRFFLVSTIFKLGNEYLANWIARWVDVLGWIAVLLLVLFYYFLLR